MALATEVCALHLDEVRRAEVRLLGYGVYTVGTDFTAVLVYEVLLVALAADLHPHGALGLASRAPAHKFVDQPGRRLLAKDASILNANRRHRTVIRLIMLNMLAPTVCTSAIWAVFEQDSLFLTEEALAGHEKLRDFAFSALHADYFALIVEAVLQRPDFTKTLGKTLPLLRLNHLYFSI